MRITASASSAESTPSPSMSPFASAAAVVGRCECAAKQHQCINNSHNTVSVNISDKGNDSFRLTVVRCRRVLSHHRRKLHRAGSGLITLAVQLVEPSAGLTVGSHGKRNPVHICHGAKQITVAVESAAACRKCSRNCIPNGAVRITGRSKCEFCRICESRQSSCR